MNIISRIKEYSVEFEKDLDFLYELCKVPNSQIVVDKNVYELYKEYFSRLSGDRLFIIEAAEQNKVIDTALGICEKMTALPAKRNAVIISIGGGIIQDITGFAANILYRGIKWIFVPTTLLAACDSCIGGKTSLNYKSYKNLLGTFYPPDEIHICSRFFQTLTDRDFKSGLGEIIKFNIIAGEGYEFDNISDSIDGLLKRDNALVDRFVEASLAFKKNFIEEDEFDRGERIKLNFAHTFGHAVEVVSKYEIPHGTAVAIGTVMANYVSYLRGMLSETTRLKTEALLLRVIDIDAAVADFDTEKIIDAMKKDKKQVDVNITAVLLEDIGTKGLVIVHDVTASEIREAVAHFVKINTRGLEGV